MADNNQQEQRQHKEEPIIIKKKKVHGGHGHHGGAWKVAYADFVTAMMAFFIVMWILASSQEVKQSVTAYFNDPGAFNFITGKRTIPIDLGLKAAGDGDGKGKEQFTITFDEKMRDSIVSQLIQKAKMDSVSAAKRVEEVGNMLKDEISKLKMAKPDLSQLLESVRIEMTKEGLRIELIESNESVFFEIGSAKLKQKAIDILTTLGNEIGKLPNYVEIEGHTDSRAYSGKNAYSNWDLSSDRANSARRILEKSGLWEGQISRVTGFGDRKLLNPDNPFDFSNRRVSILIRQLNSADFIPKTDSSDQ